MIWLLIILNMGGAIWQSPYSYRTEAACKDAADVIRGGGVRIVTCVPRPLPTEARHED